MERSTSTEGQRFLLIKHSRGWDCDRCCRWMEQNSMPFDWCYPADGDQFPDPNQYHGVISFGGASSANDCGNTDWVKAELEFIEALMSRNRAFFGICLGAQLLARVLGANVTSHPRDIREVGFNRVEPTPLSGDFLDGPKMMMQWHGEGFDLPTGTELVATGEVFENQAFRYSERVFGVQFHPEVNPAALAIWHERNKRRETGRLTDQGRAEMMSDAVKYDADITQWLGGFLKRWTTSASYSERS